MRTINRVSQSAHSARIFQLEIFWPTLESIYDLRQQCMVMDAEENEILKSMIASRSMVDMDKVLDRQRAIADARADKLAEVERKWTLIHAGCQFIAMMMNEGRSQNDNMLTPDAVYATLVRGEGLEIDGLMVLANS